MSINEKKIERAKEFFRFLEEGSERISNDVSLRNCLIRERLAEIRS